MHMLAVNFKGAAELREQARIARVSGNWEPEGSPSFDIWVPPDAKHSSAAGHLAPVDTRVVGADGSYLGEIMLWLADGKLSALEYSWVTDTPRLRSQIR